MKIFKFTEDHIKLLKRMYVGWQDDEYGAPEIDPKRPYGNSQVEADMVDILGDEWCAEKDAEYLKELHRGTQTALQIVLVTGKMEAGTYVKNDPYDGTSWRPVK
jgi:hypothetical protein